MAEITSDSICRVVMMMVKMMGPNFLIVKKMNSCPVAEVNDRMATCVTHSG